MSSLPQKRATWLSWWIVRHLIYCDRGQPFQHEKNLGLYNWIPFSEHPVITIFCNTSIKLTDISYHFPDLHIIQFPVP